MTIASFKPWVDEPDTKAKRARKLAEDVGEAIVSRRLAKIALNEDSPILTGYFSEASRDGRNSIRSPLARSPRRRAWKEALALVEQEQRRALEHGFTAGRGRRATGEPPHRHSRNAVAGVTTRRSDTLADALDLGGRGRLRLCPCPKPRRRLFDGGGAVAERRRGQRGLSASGWKASAPRSLA